MLEVEWYTDSHLGLLLSLIEGGKLYPTTGDLTIRPTTLEEKAITCCLQGEITMYFEPGFWEEFVKSENPDRQRIMIWSLAKKFVDKKLFSWAFKFVTQEISLEEYVNGCKNLNE